MRAMNILAGLLLNLLLVTAALAGEVCSQQSLRIGLIPHKNMDSLLYEYQPLLEHLSRHLGMPVHIAPAASYESVVDAIVSGGVDIAQFGPASYLLAYRRDPHIEPFASLGIEKGYFTPSGQYYQSLLLAYPDTHELDDLRGKRGALGDPASTSGSVMPNAEFPTLTGMPLAQFFGSLVYTGAHDKSLDALLDGRVDAAFVDSMRADEYLRRGRIAEGTFRVLWRSTPIPFDPYVFSSRLCPQLKARIRSALLDDQAPLKDFLASQQANTFIPASHAEYAPLLPLLEQ